MTSVQNVDIEQIVLERLATSDKTTIVIEKQLDGKMQITSGVWDGENVFLKDQMIEIRHANADNRLHVAGKTKVHDEWARRSWSTIRMAQAHRATSSLMTDVTPSQRSRDAVTGVV